jgi:hypothetical protein
MESIKTGGDTALIDCRQGDGRRNRKKSEELRNSYYQSD